MPTGSGGGISSGALPVLAAEAARATAVVIGPGLGIDDDTRELVRGMTGCGSPLVLDADALNIIARMPDIRFAPDTIITPHIVELSRLSGLGTGEIAASPLKAASDFAVRRGVTVVLKGPASFIAAPDGRAMVNIRDNTGLGKGGSGDVLAGLIGGLLAQNAPAFEAAACGVYLHSLAGALARRDLGAYAMTPRDVIERLPEAFTQVSGE